DLACVLTLRMKGPAVFKPAERALQIFDQDLQIGPVERDAAGKGFAYEPVSDGHVSDEDLDAFRLGDPFADLERAAQPYEFRIALHIGHQVEHVSRGVANPARGRKFRHRLVPLQGGALDRCPVRSAYGDRGRSAMT